MHIYVFKFTQGLKFIIEYLHFLRFLRSNDITFEDSFELIILIYKIRI